MLKKCLTGSVYFFIALGIIYLFSGNYLNSNNKSEYENCISRLKYQLDFENMYSCKYPDEIYTVNADISEEETV